MALAESFAGAVLGPAAASPVARNRHARRANALRLIGSRKLTALELPRHLNV
jgi:hypothetical protein